MSRRNRKVAAFFDYIVCFEQVESSKKQGMGLLVSFSQKSVWEQKFSTKQYINGKKGGIKEP